MEIQLVNIQKAIIDVIEKDIASNFNTQSFNQDKWQMSKLTGKVPTLNKTGALKASVEVKTQGDNIVVTSLEYGKYHNEGTSKIPQRQFIGMTDKLEHDIISAIDGEIIKQLNNF